MPNSKPASAPDCKQIGENIWLVEGTDVTFAGADMGTRMTLVKLMSGELWVHSPIKLTTCVKQLIAAFEAPVSVLVAPNKFHHLFVAEWSAQWPEAKLYVDADLLSKVPELKPTGVLGGVSEPAYEADIDQVVVGGNRLFQETAFFHKSSRTLIFTDLFINLKVDKAPLLPRLFYSFEGVVFPNGGIPRLYRWLTTDKDTARAAVSKIMEWQPEQITFAHGPPLVGEAQALLRREFSWLLD